MPKAKPVLYKPVYEHACHIWPQFGQPKERQIKTLFFESFRSQNLQESFILGIRDCTEYFSDLGMIFICKQDAKPLILVQHFTMLAYLHQIPLVTLPEGSCEDLGALFFPCFTTDSLSASSSEKKRILAFGIKNTQLPLLRNQIEQLISFKKPNFHPLPMLKRIPINSSSAKKSHSKNHEEDALTNKRASLEETMKE